MPSPIAEKEVAARQDAVPEYCSCDVLILGCGNELFGDDGFGPAVARALARRLRGQPEPGGRLLAMDVGTAVRPVLFDVLLSTVRPRKIVVVDAVDLGRPPGEVWMIEAKHLPEVKLDDFSMHQLPTSSLLRELSEVGGVEVICLVGQVSGFPSHVRPGLSAAMRGAIERAVELIIQKCR
jgi:coenzyme F420 hydrogenase subunit delta